MDQECIGCPINDTYCAFESAKLIDKCPCLYCLVKPICDKRSCEKREYVYHEHKVDKAVRKVLYDTKNELL